MAEKLMLLEKQFKKMHRLYRHSMQDILLSHGLYFGQPPILFTLLDLGGCTQKEISDALGISQATVAVSIRRLLKGGFITKAADDKDLRRNRIELTEKGRLSVLACREEIDSLFERMCRGFEESEIKDLTAFLIRISENLCAKAQRK